MSRELQLATENFPAMRNYDLFRRVILNGFKYSFCPGSTNAKAEHVNQASRVLDKVLSKYKVAELFSGTPI